MSDLLIRDVPEPLKAEIAQAARMRGQSLSTRVIDLLRKGLIAEQQAKPAPGRTAWDMLRSVFEEDGPPDGEFAEIMEGIVAERKQDFGRPVDFGHDDDELG